MSSMATNSGWCATAIAVGLACLAVAACGGDRSEDASSTTLIYSIESNKVRLEAGLLDGEDGTNIVGDRMAKAL